MCGPRLGKLEQALRDHFGVIPVSFINAQILYVLLSKKLCVAWKYIINQNIKIETSLVMERIWFKCYDNAGPDLLIFCTST